MFRIIELLGGDSAVAEKMREISDDSPSIHAVRMWEQRGSIPGHAMHKLMVLAEKRGISYKSSDFTFVPASKPAPAEAPLQNVNGFSHE